VIDDPKLHTCSAYVRFFNCVDRKPGEVFEIRAKAKQVFRGSRFTFERNDLFTLVEFGIEGYEPDIRNVSFVELIQREWKLSTVEPRRVMKMTLQALKPVKCSDESFVITLSGLAVQLPVDITVVDWGTTS